MILPALLQKLVGDFFVFWEGHLAGNLVGVLQDFRRRTNVQQLTCKIDLSSSFHYLFFSFVLIELKPFVSKGKVSGGKL